jgi:hypothetical protein
MMSYFVSKHKIAGCVPLNQLGIVDGPIVVRVIELVIVDFASERHRPAMIHHHWVVRHIKEDDQVDMRRAEDSLKSIGIYLTGGRGLQIETQFVDVHISLLADPSAVTYSRNQKSK